MGAGGGSEGGHTIEDEGIPLTKRTKLNFLGTGVAVTDDSGDDATDVTISTDGEINTTSNDGTGEGIALAKDVFDLPLKSLKASSPVSVSSDSDSITFASSAEANPAVVSQADAEAGTSVDERIWTAQRVKQAIDALGGGGSGNTFKRVVSPVPIRLMQTPTTCSLPLPSRVVFGIYP